ncbi:MAG TPA: hypothetical protein VEC99_08165, partial [Clostridia bacterium]|nr:hypothetical protein [Clostridia bacterium]
QTSGGSGNLAKMIFFDGTNQLAQLTTPPWQFLVNHLNEGAHAFSVKATDSAGVAGVSQTANVVVQSLPLNKLAIHHLVSDQLLLCFKGNAGSSYVWEKTGDCTGTWTSFCTNTAPAGVLQLTNSFSTAWPPGFFRTRMAQ